MCDYFTIKIISSKFQILFLQDFQFSSHHSSFQPSSGCHLTSSYSYDAFKLLSWYHVTKNENFLMIYILWLCRLRNYADLNFYKSFFLESFKQKYKYFIHAGPLLSRISLLRRTKGITLSPFDLFSCIPVLRVPKTKKQTTKNSDPKLKNLHSTYFFLSSKFLEVVALTGDHMTRMSSQRG